MSWFQDMEILDTKAYNGYQNGKCQKIIKQQKIILKSWEYLIGKTNTFLPGVLFWEDSFSHVGIQPHRKFLKDELWLQNWDDKLEYKDFIF